MFSTPITSTLKFGPCLLWVETDCIRRTMFIKLDPLQRGYSMPCDSITRSFQAVANQCSSLRSRNLGSSIDPFFMRLFFPSHAGSLLCCWTSQELHSKPFFYFCQVCLMNWSVSRFRSTWVRDTPPALRLLPPFFKGPAVYGALLSQYQAIIPHWTWLCPGINSHTLLSLMHS